MPKVSARFIRLLIIVVPAVMLGIWYVGGFESPYDQEKMKLVLQMVKTIPLHPTLREVGSEQLADKKTITITKAFSSNADWEVVKQYYLEVLAGDNWKLVKQGRVSGPEEGLPKKLLFIKHGTGDVPFADLFFSVAFVEENKEPGHDYILEYAWDTAEYRTQTRHVQLASSTLTVP
jgi:hypothetical protein